MARSVEMKTPEERRARHKRIMLWSFVIIILGSVLLPLTGYVYEGLQPQAVQAANKQDTNPRANFWRYVREGNSGYTSQSGPYATNVLIQNGGENWRSLRNGPVASIAPWWLAIVLLAIGAFYYLYGEAKLESRPTGKKIVRWTQNERILHWYTATLFIILAISGLSLLFGRAVLIPILGLKGFSYFADAAILLHNYLGPFFVVGILLELIAWIKHNIPSQVDWDWIKQWGGMMGKKSHPHAGRMNGGEKLWFWIIATVGIAVCITGLILDFPNFGQSREAMQLSNLIHATLGVIWISVALGHIYIGTIGTEGALEGMTTGKVSVEWAKQHHDLWYEEMRRSGRGESSEGAGYGRASPAAPRDSE